MEILGKFALDGTQKPVEDKISKDEAAARWTGVRQLLIIGHA